MNNYSFANGKNIFFISDTHFCHKKIIEFCSRPFGSVQEMDEALISNWNSVVKNDSFVFILGDFAFCGAVYYKEILTRLKGHKILIKGNHDDRNIRNSFIGMFDNVCLAMKIYIEEQLLCLSHYPYLCYNGWNLFGHVHTSKYKNTGMDFERLQYTLPTQYDVGVDFNDFTPIPWSIVKEKITYQIDNNVNLLHWLNV